MRLQVLRLVLGIVALAIVVVGAVRVLFPFLIPIAWAMILGSATWPAYRRLLAWLRGRKNVAALTMTVVLVVLVVVPVVLLGVTLLREIQPLLDGLDQWASESKPEVPAWMKQIPGVEEQFKSWIGRLGDPASREAWLRQTVWPVERIVRWSRNILHQTAMLLLTVFTLFFVYRDGEALVGEVGFLLDKIAGGRGASLLHAVRQTVRAVFFGWLLTAAMQGLLSMLGYWIVGLPAPVLLGIVTGLAAVIPFGVGLIWIPAAVSLLAAGFWGKALFLTAWSLGVVGLIDNFLRPLFISGPARIPFILVFFGVMGGLLVFGPLGLVLGPVFLAVLLALWRQGREALLEPDEAA